MRDPRDGLDPNKLLLAALLGLLIWMIAGVLLAHELRPTGALDPTEALRVSQQAIGTELGDYRLTDSDGTTVRLAGYRGKPLLLSFVYTGCYQVCPAATEFLARAVGQAQQVLGSEAFHVVSVGFNLPFDTPSAMREFRKRHVPGARNWAFLSGDAGTIKALARDTGFVWVPSAGGFDHLTQVTVIDANGRVAQQIYGESFALPLLIAPLKDLVAGVAPTGQDLTGLLDRVRILCTVYDPQTGRYRLDYGLFIELLAGLSILIGIVAYFVVEWRRGRKLQAS